MSEPLISVVIPVYGVEKYIEETIRSVMAQTYSNWEIIAVSDGSTDNSEAVILKLQEEESRIQYFWKENSGVSDTRNYGIARSKGEYIAFLDADDTWIENKLELQVKTFKENPSIGWCFGDAWLADENMVRNEYRRGYDDNLLESILIWEKDIVPGPCSNIIVRKECFENGIAYDINLTSGADQDMTIQLASKYEGKHIEHPVWVYRVLPNSMSSSVLVTEKDHSYVYIKAKKNKLFKNRAFEKECFGNLYLMIAGSWWVNGNNKARGLYFMLKAIMIHPKSITNIMKKMI
jgi:glycosyltransferase involved in cell wall biosynthesis